MSLFLNRIGIVLIAVCAASTLLSVLAGSVLPAATPPLFSVCELPCVVGIQPGKTEFQGALSILHENLQDLYVEPLQTSPTAPLNFSGHIGGYIVRGTVTRVGDRVRSLTIVDDVRLIDLMGTLNTPSCMYTERIISEVSTLAMVQWRLSDGVTATAFLNIDRQNSWEAYAVVRSLRFSVSDAACRSGRLEPRMWQGFPQFWRFRFTE